LCIFSQWPAIGEEAVIEERKKLEATTVKHNAKPEDEVGSVLAVGPALAD